MKYIFLLIFLLLILACTQKTVHINGALNEQSNKNKNIVPESAKVNNATHIINDSVGSIENFTPYNKTEIYLPFNYNFALDLHGISQSRVERVIFTINESYFDLLDRLTLINSNYNATKSDIEGFYLNNEITIYIDEQWSDLKIKRILLHELKHHYCYNHGFYWFTNEEAHQGCFLNTSIDKEYGFIK